MRRGAISVLLFHMACTDGYTIQIPKYQQNRWLRDCWQFGKIGHHLKQSRQLLSAQKSKSKEEQVPPTLTPSEMVQEMAAFLAVQLLQVVLKEVSDGEGKSQLRLEDVEKLAKTLQGPLVETKKAQDNLEPTWAAAGDAVEELWENEGISKLDISSSYEESEASTLKKLMAEEDKEANEKEDEVAEMMITNSTIIEETSSPALQSPNVANLSNNATGTSVSTPKVENTASTVTSSAKISPSVVRIPDVVSAEFGRPLEVVASNVEPLRHLPRLDPKTEVEERTIVSASSDTTEKSQLLKSRGDIYKQESESQRQMKPEPAESKNPKSAPEKVLSHEIREGNIVEARLQFESKTDFSTMATFLSDQNISLPETESTSHGRALQDVTVKNVEEFNVSGELPLIDQATNVETTESKVESMESIRKVLSQPPTNHSQLSISKISESRLKSIIEARRQPKSIDEEANIAENYAKMSIEDRAFAILFDLGMIDVNLDPRDPSYDHADDEEICEQLHFPS
jgi:hypothetical protein